jgi:hypothetical protein
MLKRDGASGCGAAEVGLPDSKRPTRASAAVLGDRPTSGLVAATSETGH